jgi:hypothetical protein
MNDFYIGYLAKASPRLARTMIRVVSALAVVAVFVAVAMVFGQSPFAAGNFEFDQFREYQGVIEEWPYPMLTTPDARFLLVAPGKHGLSVKGLQGRTVNLEGSLIQRGRDRMLEVVPGTLKPSPAPVSPSKQIVDLGMVKLTGEIVDTKCYLGVMNPGNGKVHRDCAVRCISGGVPPAFIARDASGQTRVLLLTGQGGRRLHREVLPFVAEPIEISGRLERSGSTLILEADPSAFRHPAK